MTTPPKRKARQTWPHEKKGKGRNYRPSKEAQVNQVLEKRPKFRPDDVPYQKDLAPGWLTVAETKAKFIRKLRKHGCVRHAQKLCHISTSLVYRWRDEDPKFANSWRTAWEAVVDELEGATMRRAIRGYKEKVYYLGAECGTKIKHEPSLAIFMLRKNRPDKYDDRTTPSVSPDEYAAKVRETLRSQDEAAKAALEGGV